MADFYALEFVGVADGTVPAQLADGRAVNSKVRSIRATKTATALAAADRMYLGRLPRGAIVTEILVTTDTSFGTTTLSIGTTATPAKYLNGVTNTVTERPVILGPRATAAVLAPLAADEDIWLTVATATLAGATVAAFVIRYKIAS